VKTTSGRSILAKGTAVDRAMIGRENVSGKGTDMDFLLYWTTWEQIIFVLVVFSLVSVSGLYLVRILVTLERLKQNHEVAGFTFGVIGAFYGLLLAFVIVAAWERFDRADAEVQGEGVALTSLYRLSKGFTEPVATKMQGDSNLHPHANRRTVAGYGEISICEL
jgi:hypothetical protein